MKTRITVALVLIGVIAVLGIIFIRKTESPNGNVDSQAQADSTTVATGRTNLPAQAPTVPRPASTSFAPDISNTAAASPIVRSPNDILNAYSNQLHQPITFYGRIVDQDNTVVPGANVQFIWSHYINPETTYDTNVVSDINGGFLLTGVVGATLSVSVSKAGYYPVANSSTRQFSYAKIPFHQPFQPDPGKPVVFQLRKKGGGVALITSGKGMSSEFAVTPPRDGTPIKIDLLQQQVSDAGQIQISQIKPDPDHWKQADQWGFKMTIPDGGFVEENDEFPFEAPAVGYQPTVEFHFQKQQGDWALKVKNDYYFKFGNPPKFGHLHVLTAVDSDYVGLTYQINPDGTQNLEPQ